MLSTVLGIIAGIALLARLYVVTRRRMRRRREAPEALLGPARGVLEAAELRDTGRVGYPELIGRYRGLPVRILPVVDTLAVRKLPSLWLLLTIPEPLPIKGTFDVMIRPAGPTTFSNFERLPVIVETPPEFPLHAVIRTEDPHHILPPHVIGRQVDLLHQPAVKELLISPKGVRLVWLLAEADRARYGILRQAEFGEVTLDPDIVRGALDRLIEIRSDILAWKEKTS